MVNGTALDDIPEWLMRKPKEQSEVTAMKTPTKVTAPDEAVATAEAAPVKAAKVVKAKANGHAKPAKAKAAPKAAAKPAKAVKPAKVVKAKAEAKPAKKAAKGKTKAAATERKPREVNPATLDAFGFRKGTIKSNAAALYAKGKGATLAEVKEKLKSAQFNLLTEVETRGFTVEKNFVKNTNGRKVTRYHIVAK